MSKRIAIATALTFAALGFAPASADVIPVTGEVTGLDIADVARCGAINLTLVVNRINEDDVIAGTSFSVEKLSGIDLNTQAGWDAVRALDVDKARAADKDGSWAATTDDQGRAHFTGLPIGAYLVTATVPDDGHHPKPASFILTLPVGEDSKWNCAPIINAKFEPTPPPPETKPPYPPYTPPKVPPTESTPPPPETPRTPEFNPPPSTPRTPAVLGQRNPPRNQDRVLGLASTGAAVTGIVGAAAVLMVLGLILARRRKNKK